jgi:Tetratricopeptide repeat/Cytochrome c554 and c-prime
MQLGNQHFFYVIFFCIFLCGCSSPSSELKLNPQYASLSDSTRYVGMETCAGCHRDIYETYKLTGMGQSFEAASKKKSSASYSSDNAIRDHFKNLAYHPYWNRDSLCLKEFRLAGRDTVYQRNEVISYIVGSGQHTNSHMINVNGYVYQAPATFYTQRGIWDLPPGYENGANSRFSRKIELECMSCHNAFPVMAEGSENKYSHVPAGIDCERCHGPGSRHVEEKRLGRLVDVTKEVDYSIVNPAKLPVALQLDVCQRCHIQGNAVLAEGKSFFDFRPAMPLSDVMNVFMPVYKGQEEEHIMASHAERMKMSRCFTVSVAAAEKKNEEKKSLFPYRDAMTCVTCHNPHVSVKVTDQSIFNDACKGCHGAVQVAAKHEGMEKSNTLCSEDKTKLAAANNNCVHCHMPKNSTIDIPHVRTTDHFIRKPLPVASVNRIKEFIGIACINNPGVDPVTKGKAYLSYYEKFDPKKAYLDSAKKYLSDKTPEDGRRNFRALVRWAYLAGDYKRVIGYAESVTNSMVLLSRKDFSNEDAWTAYRIGEAYTQTGNDVSSLTYYQKAVDLAPFIPEFRNKLGTALMANQKIEDARQHFEFIIRENPGYSSAFINLGYLRLTAYSDVSGADALYDRALSLDPDNEQALINKAGTQVFLNNKPGARKLLKQVLAMNPKNSRARELLKVLK